MRLTNSIPSFPIPSFRAKLHERALYLAKLALCSSCSAERRKRCRQRGACMKPGPLVPPLRTLGRTAAQLTPLKTSGCWCLGGKCQQRNLVECTRIINLVSLVRNSFKKKLAQMRVPSLEPPTPPYHVKSTANSCLRRMIGSTRSRHPCADKLDSKKNGYSSTPPTPPSPPARSSSFNNNLLPKHSTIFPLYHQFLSSSIFLVSNSQHVQGVSATRAP